jgi:hypothetical protein
MHKYTFKFEETDEINVPGFPTTRDFKHEITIDSAEAWEVPLKAFVDLLSSIYGYDISESITLDVAIRAHNFKYNLRDDDISTRVRDALRETDEDNEF